MAKKFRVTVERQMIVSGYIEVLADGPEQAEKQVIKMMDDREKPLQTLDERIEWDTPTTMDNTFATTGDVEEA